MDPSWFVVGMSSAVAVASMWGFRVHQNRLLARERQNEQVRLAEERIAARRHAARVRNTAELALAEAMIRNERFTVHPDFLCLQTGGEQHDITVTPQLRGFVDSLGLPYDSLRLPAPRPTAPMHQWSPGGFYLTPDLTLKNPAPVYDAMYRSYYRPRVAPPVNIFIAQEEHRD